MKCLVALSAVTALKLSRDIPKELNYGKRIKPEDAAVKVQVEKEPVKEVEKKEKKAPVEAPVEAAATTKDDNIAPKPAVIDQSEVMTVETDADKKIDAEEVAEGKQENPAEDESKQGNPAEDESKQKNPAEDERVTFLHKQGNPAEDESKQENPAEDERVISEDEVNQMMKNMKMTRVEIESLVKLVPLGCDAYLKGGRQGKWCHHAGNDGIYCNKDFGNGLTDDFVFHMGVSEGKLAFKSKKNGKYCADEFWPGRMKCNRDKAQGWERFSVEGHGDGIKFRGGKSNQYCCDEEHGIICNRAAAQGWERFWVTKKDPKCQGLRMTIQR